MNLNRLVHNHSLNKFLYKSFTTKVCNHLSISAEIDPSSFIASSADIIGNVSLAAKSSIFYNCTLRADINKISIGYGSNIQDNTVIHLSSTTGTIIGNYVTVGHNAILHACTIQDNVLIGMGAIIMDDVSIGKNSIVAAGSLVSKGKQYDDYSLLVGSPAKVIRKVTPKEVEFIKHSAEKYIQVAQEHAEFQKRRKYK